MKTEMFRWKRKSFFNYDLENKDQTIIKKEKTDVSDGELEKKFPICLQGQPESQISFNADFDFFRENSNGFGVGPAGVSEPERTDQSHKARETVKSDKIMKLLMFKNRRTGSNDTKMESTNDYTSKSPVTSAARPSLNLNGSRLNSERMSTSNNGSHANSPRPSSSPVKTPSQKRREAQNSNPDTIRGTAKAKLSATVNKKFINEDGNFTCTLCPYISKYITHFEMHMKHSHPGVPIFLCEICGFETKAKNYLTVHVMNHLGLKPYKCSECDYASPRKEYLDLHLKRHFKVYCFKCLHCPYTTYRQDYLARHVSEKH